MCVSAGCDGHGEEDLNGTPSDQDGVDHSEKVGSAYACTCVCGVPLQLGYVAKGSTAYLCNVLIT